MKVLVLGAGVIGTTCAYYLSKAGHEVTVVDRQPGPALETSFGNAGGVCPGFGQAVGRQMKIFGSGDGAGEVIFGCFLAEENGDG